MYMYIYINELVYKSYEILKYVGDAKCEAILSESRFVLASALCTTLSACPREDRLQDFPHCPRIFEQH